MNETKNKVHETIKEISLELHPNGENKRKGLTTLQGFTTSQIRKREKLSDTPAYCFLKTSSQEQDIPTIFRIKENSSWIKPKIPKHSYLEVQGTFANSEKSSRLSFTAYSYKLLNQEAKQEILTHDK